MPHRRSAVAFGFLAGWPCAVRPLARASTVAALGALVLAACTSAPYYPPSRGDGPYTVDGGVRRAPRAPRGYDAVGVASWYGGRYHGRRTASGQIFDQNGHTAAHPTLPFGTRVRVTNLENGRSTVLVINDRGPFVRGRIIDVSRHAASELGFLRQGTTRVRVQTLGSGPS